MDFATLIGFVSAISVVSAAVLFGGEFALVVDAPSLLIVFAGAISVVLMRFSMKNFFGAITTAFHTILHQSDSLTTLISQIVLIADVARKEGVLALEKIKIQDHFLKQAVQYLIDGIDIEIIEHTLYNDMIQTMERQVQGQQVFRAIAEVSPAMGMIGTLIGLIKMMSHMSDPSNIGPAMSIALLTTLYGAMLANMVANPIAGKLELRSEEEKLKNLMIIDAILAISKKQNPRLIREMLNTYLPVSNRTTSDKQDGK